MAQSNALDVTCQPIVDATASVLLCGAAPEQLMRIWPNAARKQSGDIRFDLAIYVDPQANVSEQEFQQTLAAARDRWAKQVIALIPIGSNTHVLEESLFSLGFSRRPLPKFLNSDYIAYCFSISFYKKTPDWLNSKYWANPERWTKR